MANPNPKQSSSLKKLLFLGAGLVVIVVVAFPSGSAPTTDAHPPKTVVATSSTKKDSLYTKEDENAKFERISAATRNSFVPLVTKGMGGKLGIDGIPINFTGGEGSWTYTGNMTVDGIPNALLENSVSGDGVFLRPGQHWKTLRLIAVKDDSIELEGPDGSRKTVFFADKSLNVTSSSGNNLSPLPPAAIQGNLPSGPAQPGPARPNRTPRGQQANQTNSDALVGPIDAGADFTSSVDMTSQNNNANYPKKNRRIGNNQ